MELSRHPLCRLCRFVFCVTIALLWSGLDRRAIAQTAADQQSQSAQQVADRVDHYYQLIEAGDRQIPRDSFDPVPIVKALNADPDAMFQWVRDHTFWIPYHGALRGPTGVLMDRRGNSLDRALLLAQMFHYTGKTVRLAHATLPPDLAKELLAKLRPVPANPLMPNSPTTAPSNADTLETLCQKCGVDPAEAQMNLSRARLDVQRMQESTFDRVADQAPAVADLAGNATAPGGIDRAEAISDHWWVQMADPSGSQWIDFDPLTPDAAPGHALVTPGETILLPPEDGKIHLDDTLCHRIQIRVIVEKWNGSQCSQSTILKVSLKPAEIFGQSIILTNYAPDFPASFDFFGSDMQNQLKTQLLALHEWAPALTVGSSQFIQASFTDSGQVNPKPMLDPMGRTGNKVGGSVQGVLSAFDTTPPPPSAPAGTISAEWIEYEIDSPSQPPRTFRREVFDLLGPAARAAKPASMPTFTDSQRLDRALALVSEIHLLPIVCQSSPQFMTHVMSAGMLKGRKLMEQAIRQDGNLKQDDWVNLLQTQMSLPGRLFAFSALRMSTSRFQSSLYYNSPNLVTYHEGLRQNAQGNLLGYEALDIVANDLAVRDGASADPFAVRIEQGVVDTVIEALILAQPGRVSNTSELFAARNPAGGDWQTLHKGDTAALQKLALSDDCRTRIQQNLDDGYLVIAPARAKAMQDGTPSVAWWIVNPSTGQTLGIGQTGWGTSMVEYAAVGVCVGFGAFGACVSMASIGTPGGLQGLSTKTAFTCVGLGILAGLAVPLGVLAAGGAAVASAPAAAAVGGGLGVGNAVVGGFSMSGVK